ncbi:MAG: phage protein Gp27 family protein [Stenotrophomonas sp.]|uniref:phage protein Gp27 family protein n=1 Tax=Stenotrophomonas sp. TaxID=69392 RepID=UPI003D6D8C8B
MSKIDLLPADLRAELDRRLVANAFGGSVPLSEWLAEQGFEISKTTVNERAKKLKRRLAAISASTEAMKMVAATAPDNAVDRGSAIIGLVQTDLFEALLEFQEAAEQDSDEISPAQRIALYAKTAKSISELTRAAIIREKWAGDVREKTLLEAAKRVESAAIARGLSAGDASFWRKTVLMGVK